MTQNPTKVVNYGEPNFLRDIVPYFLASYAFMVSHIVYQLTGNLIVPIWLAYIFSLSAFWRSKEYVEGNLDKASERAFQKDKRFMLPLYSFVIIDALNWLWCLCLVAGVNPLANTSLGFVFENHHGTGLANWVVFTFVWGYMAGLNGLAGHELIHKREPINKALGMFTYTKILYSHFYLEHGSGHHRNVATELDPASAMQGETFYEFFPRSAFGGLFGTYNREIERIEAEFEEKCRQDETETATVPLFLMICDNRVVQYFVLHCSILCAIYVVFGP